MNWSTFVNIFSYASISSVLIPIITYLVAPKKNRLKNLVATLLLTSLISDVGNEIYVFLGYRGALVHNIFFVCQIVLLCLVYSYMLRPKFVAKIAEWMFPVIALVYTISFQSIIEYQSPIRVIGGLMMISFAARYFWQMYLYLPTEDLRGFLKGWVNMAVFSYFTFNLFLFACANYFFKNESTVVAMAFWSFHNLNNIIKNCLLAFGLYFSNETSILKLED